MHTACFRNDASFDWLYPENIQKLSRRHWTPMSVAKKAAHFLADAPGKKILDVGSGVGKFCIIGANFFPDCYFCGVEQRRELFDHAHAAKTLARVPNADFIHGNFTQIEMGDYDNFYFYNSFFENIDQEGRIDDQLEYSVSLYIYYSRYLFRALNARPPGTRLVTFHSLEEEVPPDYKLVDASPDMLLKMWIKW